MSQGTGTAGRFVVACALAILFVGQGVTGAHADGAERNPQLKRWLLAAPPKTLSPLDRQKAFSYRQRLQSRSGALERRYHLGDRGKHTGGRHTGRLGRAGRPSFAGREVFDPLQNSRSELSRIGRATRR